MFVIWCRWRYAGEDPFVTYHGGATTNPPYPDRVESIRAGFALFAHQMEMKAAGAKTGGA